MLWGSLRTETGPAEVPERNNTRGVRWLTVGCKDYLPAYYSSRRKNLRDYPIINPPVNRSFSRECWYGNLVSASLVPREIVYCVVFGVTVVSASFVGDSYFSDKI